MWSSPPSTFPKFSPFKGTDHASLKNSRWTFCLRLQKWADSLHLVFYHHLKYVILSSSILCRKRMLVNKLECIQWEWKCHFRFGTDKSSWKWSVYRETCNFHRVLLSLFILNCKRKCSLKHRSEQSHCWGRCDPLRGVAHLSMWAHSLKNKDNPNYVTNSHREVTITQCWIVGKSSASLIN